MRPLLYANPVLFTVWPFLRKVGLSNSSKFLLLAKGRFQKRFSGIRPLRGYPPPALTENQSEKKKVFFLRGKGGYPPPPLTESPLSFSGKFFPKRAKNDVFFIK